METTTKTAAAMTAARVSADVWYGANTAHSGDLGRVQGRTVSVAGTTPARDRGVIASDVVGHVAPITGPVPPRLEGPPV